ncbi:hypothetical protein ACFO0J_10055 [Castellaniella hirudinis]|uniref:ApeA N-terminal domain-containing protein n=1 Tax=Castellaniella hirudinis TaxID=1144617 RepID=A0ABV8RZR1_9BURK
MKHWDWEIFNTVVTADMYTVSDCGPVFGPVMDFKIERDTDLNLILTTTSSTNSTSTAIKRMAGEVYQADAKVELISHTGNHAVALGVDPYKHIKTWGDRREQGSTVEQSSINSLEWTSHNAVAPAYIIDWVGNMASFIWPDSDNIFKEGEERRTLKSARKEIIFSTPIDSDQYSRSCTHLIIDDIEIFVGASRTKPDHVKNPGFILYIGTPNEETRGKIRNCLSFFLGNYLLYLGNTKFDSEWRPVKFLAKSGPALAKEVDNLRGYPPAPLHLKAENAISANLLEEMVSSLYKIYDTYELQSAFWGYWHAMAAPLHMKAVHFGAAIESLQSKFLKNTPAVRRSIIDNANIWTTLQKKISATITATDLHEDAKKILINKVINLNSAPQSVMTERFFSALDLEIGTLEKSVWKNRNRAAHGGTTTGNDVISTIRENKVLRIMMCRILLALGGATDLYYDYYTLGRPRRLLAKSIPDDNRA